MVQSYGPPELRNVKSFTQSKSSTQSKSFTQRKSSTRNFIPSAISVTFRNPAGALGDPDHALDVERCLLLLDLLKCRSSMVFLYIHILYIRYLSIIQVDGEIFTRNICSGTYENNKIFKYPTFHLSVQAHSQKVKGVSAAAQGPVPSGRHRERV